MKIFGVPIEIRKAGECVQNKSGFLSIIEEDSVIRTPGGFAMTKLTFEKIKARHEEKEE